MSSDAREIRQVRLSKNQALFREVNERVVRVAQEFATYGALSVVCECADVDCGAQIELTHEEYERVRAVPHHFLVKPGHETSDVEDVVEATDGYVIVAKLEAGRRVAIESDLRHSRARD